MKVEKKDSDMDMNMNMSIMTMDIVLTDLKIDLDRKIALTDMATILSTVILVMKEIVL